MSDDTEQDVARAADAYEREVDNLRELVLASDPRIQELEDRLAATERQLHALEVRMNSAEARPDPLEDRIDHAERSEDALLARVTALEAKGMAAEQWTEEVRRGLEGGQDALNGLRADIDDLRKGLVEPE